MAKARVVVCAYRFEGNKQDFAWNGAAVPGLCLRRAVLNDDGEWEVEPMPSNRDQALWTVAGQS